MMTKVVKSCKRWIVYSFSLGMLFASSQAFAVLNYKTVMTITNPTKVVPEGWAQTLNDALSSEIFISKRFRLVRKDIVDATVEELKRRGKTISVASLESVIQNFDVDGIFIFDLDYTHDGRLVATLRLIDARDGSVVAFENIQKRISKHFEKPTIELDRLAKELYFRILNTIPYQAIVISVNGKFITIDAGGGMRLKNGDFLRIVRIDYRDHSIGTGEPKNPRVQDVGTLKLVDTKDEVSLGVIVALKDGETVSLNDKVLLHGLNFQEYFRTNRLAEQQRQKKQRPRQSSSKKSEHVKDPGTPKTFKDLKHESVERFSFYKEIKTEPSVVPDNDVPISAPMVMATGNIGIESGPMVFIYQMRSKDLSLTLSSPSAFVNYFNIFGEFEVMESLYVAGSYLYGFSTLAYKGKDSKKTVTNLKTGHSRLEVTMKHLVTVDFLGSGSGLQFMPLFSYVREEFASTVSEKTSLHRNKQKEVSARSRASLDVGLEIEVPLAAEPVANIHDLNFRGFFSFSPYITATDKNFKTAVGADSSSKKIFGKLLFNYDHLVEFNLGMTWDMTEYVFNGGTDIVKGTKRIIDQKILFTIGASYKL